MGLLRLCENLLILGFTIMIAMVFGNVVLRYGFDSGITSSEEASRMIFVWLTFGGAVLVAREHGHLGMTTVVQKLGERGRFWCRVASEALSLFCMILLTIGCWKQTLINANNSAPVTGVPLAVTYAAGLVCGIGIGALNVWTLWRLARGEISGDALIAGVESEELASLEQSKKP